MKNKELAKIFYDIAGFLNMEKVEFKPIAYRNVAIALESLEQDIDIVYTKGGLEALEKIPGVGENISLKIEEFLKTGKIKYYENLKKKMPINLVEIINVEGMGPKRAKILYQKLKIRNLKDLEKAAKAGKIALLPGFGEKAQANILDGIVFLKTSKGRFLLGEILPISQEIETKLRKVKGVKKISAAGSLRRKKQTIGDLDFLVVTNKPQIVMGFFTSLPGIVKIWRKGPVLSSIRMKQGFDVDLRVFKEKSFGAALQYFTGSKEHNIETRKIAMGMGLKLNEYGLFQGKKMIAGKTEKDIYKALGMDLAPPEIRENQGEIEMALAHQLPKLISYQDIKGDLHCHSNWNGGVNSIKEMAETALNMGYEYLGISDHTKFLKVENGLNEKQLIEQRKEIDVLNSKYRHLEISKFRILQGAEVNILNNGSIDIKDKALQKLDYAMAGIHSSFKMPKEQMTARIIRAMKNPYIKIIVHPTGRLLKKRQGYEIDFPKILRAAKEFDVILEINASPVRLDLDDKNVRMAKESGVKMIINSDAHHKSQLKYMEFGTSQARRGWAEKKDIVNTNSLNKLLKFLK